MLYLGHTSNQPQEIEMGRGKKICSKCNTVNGVRSFNCKNCGHAFEMKKARKKKREEIVTDYTSLKKGDIINVVGGSGSYYTGEDGERHYMVDRGEYQVQGIKDEGILAYSTTGGYNYIYMGKERKSKLLATITNVPCKIKRKV
tara:strand:+ start:219 stop:650 length:432 start_codon:yes stop_codon:yes gene_type:complete